MRPIWLFAAGILLAATCVVGEGATLPANTWRDAKLTFHKPKEIRDAAWRTTDGYCGSTYDSKTGRILWRTGVASKKFGLSPGYYSNATLAWAPAAGEAKVIEVAALWGGGSYGFGKLLPGFKDHPMPAPRHVYDAFDYIEGQDSFYMLLGSYWKVGLRGSNEAARKQLKVDAGSTWRYSLETKRWQRVDDGPSRVCKRLISDGARTAYWPEGKKLLFFGAYGRHYAEFDLGKNKWERVALKGKFPSLKGSGPGSSTWDSKRQLWVMRSGPKVIRFDPRTKAFETLPAAYEVTDDRRFKFNRYLGTGVTYVSKHDAYLIHCPKASDTFVYEIERGKWKQVNGGKLAPLIFGNLEYDVKSDLVGLVRQLNAFRFRYVPEGDKKESRKASAASGSEKAK